MHLKPEFIVMHEGKLRRKFLSEVKRVTTVWIPPNTNKTLADVILLYAFGTQKNPFSKLFLLRLNFNLRVHRGSVCGLTWRHLQPQHLSQEVQQVIKLHFTCVKDINSKLKVNFFGSFDFGLVVVVSNQLITIQIWSFSIWDIYLHVAYVVRDFGTLELNGAHFSYAWQMRAWKFLALILSDLPKLN